MISWTWHGSTLSDPGTEALCLLTCDLLVLTRASIKGYGTLVMCWVGFLAVSSLLSTTTNASNLCLSDEMLSMGLVKSSSTFHLGFLAVSSPLSKTTNASNLCLSDEVLSMSLVKSSSTFHLGFLAVSSPLSTTTNPSNLWLSD